MAAWTSSDITILCPELVTSPVIDAAVFTYFIALAERQVNPDVFGDRVVEAGAYLTAHLMLRAGYGKNAAGVGGAGAAAGPITSISVGKVSVGYATTGQSTGAAGDSELSTTRPGSAFMRLVELACPSPTLLDSEIPDAVL